KGEFLCLSISHLTVDFFTVVKYGYEKLRRDAENAYAKNVGTNREAFSKSVLSALKSLEIYHNRYLEALFPFEDKRTNYKNLLQVPKYGARNFHEAVQSLWFIFSFIRLCGNWPGIGRIDLLLGDYLKQDLESGVLTLDEAREILAHLFIKGCEWIHGGESVSGDAQFYQNIVLAGVNENGDDVTNEVTYLVLDILEELGISDFPTAIRINSHTGEKLLTRAAEVISHGGGTVAIYNEDLIIESLVSYGYPPKEAANFANDGCWEIQIPGKTTFTYVPFDGLAILQKITLNGYQKENFATFEEIYAAYVRDLGAQTELIYSGVSASSLDNEKKAFRKSYPSTVVSLFENDCIKRGLSYLEGGTVYSIVSPHFGGFADTVNSLYAIKKTVFDDKKTTLHEFFNALRNNWQGYEPLRRYVLTSYLYYGNDNSECDCLAARLADDFATLCQKLDGRCPIKFPAGISTFGRQIEWASSRLASPHGRKNKEVLAGNASPTPASEEIGPTAIIKSYASLPLVKIVNGSALDLHLFPDSTDGNKVIDTLKRLVRGFVTLGGQFMQIDVNDKNILLDAQKHPEKYRTLSVRVSGWNARFITLDKEWQDMIIDRI
ncbi:MAG: pyruvate formate lyase family protein, partial [Candidatus Scatosoma sp.]